LKEVVAMEAGFSKVFLKDVLVYWGSDLKVWGQAYSRRYIIKST
jgi:hypothetical protein